LHIRGTFSGMFVAQVIGDRGCLKIVGGEEKEGEKGGKHEKGDGKACSCESESLYY